MDKVQVTYQTNNPTAEIDEHDLSVINAALVMMVPKDRQDTDYFKKAIRIVQRKLAVIHSKTETTTDIY